MARAQWLEVRLRNRRRIAIRRFLGKNFFRPLAPDQGEPLAKGLRAGLGKSRSLRGQPPSAPSDKARDECAGKVALLLRKRSPRPPLPQQPPEGDNASALPTLSSSRRARGRRCFAGSGGLDQQATVSRTTAPGSEYSDMEFTLLGRCKPTFWLSSNGTRE